MMIFNQKALLKSYIDMNTKQTTPPPPPPPLKKKKLRTKDILFFNREEIIWYKN